jgi:predicted DNA-binding transcriptional regulator AlpA
MDQRVLRPAAAAAYIGLSRASLYRLERAGELPPRVILGPHAAGWFREDLDGFLASRPRGARPVDAGATTSTSDRSARER